MQVWTSANQKGGVGKTTTAISLAGLLIEQNKRVLLIDLDPHGSMTSYFGYDPDKMEDSVYSLFESNRVHKRMPLATIMAHTPFENLQLLPASTSMVALDRHLGAEEGMGLVIRKTLQQYENYFDHVLIDCPPTLGILMINALAASERLIIPVQTEFLAIKGLERMLNTLKMITMSGKHSMEYLVVPTMYDARTKAARECYEHIKEIFPQHLWHGLIPVDTKFRQASQQGQPINYLYPNSRGAEAYRQLLRTLKPDDDQSKPKLAEVVSL